jgi:hypothetical protein
MADQRPIVTPSSLELLANSDSLVFGQSIVLANQSSSPGTPAAGYGIIYAKTDGNLYFKNSSGTEYQL